MPKDDPLRLRLESLAVGAKEVEKICGACGQSKRLNEYNPHPNRPSGKDHLRRECRDKDSARVKAEIKRGYGR